MFVSTSFPTGIESIEKRIGEIQPEKYGRTRNFKNGAVTRLSPYISRGVITTRQVYDHIKQSEVEWSGAEKLIQELSRNIPEIVVYTGSFEDISNVIPIEKITYKEHPTNCHYKGKQEERTFISSVRGYHNSFF